MAAVVNADLVGEFGGELLGLDHVVQELGDVVDVFRRGTLALLGFGQKARVILLDEGYTAG